MALLETTIHIEAPNWTRDGASLIVNGSGRLYRILMSSPELRAIDTGFAVNINNDHGVSPGGKSLAISDFDGEWRELHLPFAALRRNTAQAHRKDTSILPCVVAWRGHVGLPVANRGSTYQIYTCPAAGGEERQLTDGYDHCDGPNYTRDGKWVWFNGERASSVQLWRMRPDGSEPQCMTNDSRVNWFAHPSPNRVDVLYLSYEPNTRRHPAMQNVELRLIAADGGGPKKLLRIIRGQGTMNVPCWAPHGRRSAFVSYTH